MPNYRNEKNAPKFADLFSGTQSVKKDLTILFKVEEWKLYDGIWYGLKKIKGLTTNVVQYAGFDIESPEDENIIFDLSQDDIINKLKKKLGDYNPNFFWCSPICNAFSIVLTGKGGNYYFELDKEKETIKPRENWNIKVQPHMEKYQNKEGHDKARAFAELSLKLHNNTRKIVQHFGVPFAIENPATAYSQYLYKDLIKNDTNYCMYGFDYSKRTSIYSNKELHLLKCNHKSNPEYNGDKHYTNTSGTKTKNNPKWRRPRHWKKGNSTYANRATVPPKLIAKVIHELTGGLYE